MRKEQNRASNTKGRERTRAQAADTRNQGIAPLQQEGHKFVEQLKPSLAAAYCEPSPTKAHHRNCEHVNVPGVDHKHERQMCKYCKHIIWTPCFLCRERAEDKAPRHELSWKKVS